MPLGLVFPFNFNFVPSRGEDRDALDVLLLAISVFPAGSVVLGKVTGVLEGVQIEAQALHSFLPIQGSSPQHGKPMFSAWSGNPTATRHCPSTHSNLVECNPTGFDVLSSII
jgi:hypothetical protein